MWHYLTGPYIKHSNTVAVITTLVIGSDGKQRVISAALNAQRMQQVQEILNSAQQERIEEEPCVGFHCLVEAKEANQQSARSDSRAGPARPASSRVSPAAQASEPHRIHALITQRNGESDSPDSISCSPKHRLCVFL